MKRKAVDELRQRVFLVAVAGLSAILPPFGFVGAAAITLLTLRSGALAGMAIAVQALLLAVVLRWILGDTSAMGWVLAGLTLFPAVLLADLLRTRGSLDLVVQVWFLMGLVLVLVTYGMVTDPAQSWRTLIAGLLDRLQASGNGFPVADRERLVALLPYKLMTGSAFANLAWYSLGGLFLGRSWQARLENPGGFRREFQDLRLGFTLFVITLATWAAALLGGTEMILALAMVQAAFWLLQGLAVIHVAAGRQGRPALLLGIFYGMLFVAMMIGNPLAILVPLLGLSDQVFDYRKRWQSTDSDAA